jgi:hypothetical protein
MLEGTTSRVMVAGRPYGEFYFYSVNPEYFGYHLVRTPPVLLTHTIKDDEK